MLPTQEVTLRRPRGLPGVELWTIQRSVRSWTAFHTTYVFCTPARLDSHQTWRCRGNTHRLSATSTILFEPGELHVATEIGAPADLHFLLVAPEVLQGSLGAGGSRPRFATPQIDDPGLVGAFGRLRRALEEPESEILEQQHYFSAYLRALLERAASAPAADPALSRCDQAVSHVRAVIERRFADRLTLDDLTIETGFSKFYLERSFNERYGLPIHQFLKKVRIARALALLRQGSRPAEVARAVGFADQPHLTRVFRNELGFTPRMYWAATRNASNNGRS
jgi:AraC-like DNA-binding protein